MNWTIILLGCGILAVIFALYLLDRIGIKIKTALKIKFIVWSIAIAVVIYGWKRWGIVAEHDVGQWKWVLFLAITGLLLYLVAVNWLNEFRCKTKVFIGNGVFGSCATHYDIGNWHVWYIGTSGATSKKEGFIFPWGFCQKIAICPIGTYAENVTSGWVSNVQFYQRALGRIPPLLKKEITSDIATIFARDQIYIGVSRTKLLIEDPDIKKLQGELEIMSAKYNDLETDFDDVAVNNEKYTGHLRRIKILSKSDQGQSQRPPQQQEYD